MPLEKEIAERLPPHSKEAEQGVLGAMLRDNAVISDVVQIINHPDFFYSDAHQKIFSATKILNDMHFGTEPLAPKELDAVTQTLERLRADADGFPPERGESPRRVPN